MLVYCLVWAPHPFIMRINIDRKFGGSELPKMKKRRRSIHSVWGIAGEQSLLLPGKLASR